MKNARHHILRIYLRDIRGASAIEAAICFPIILMAFFAIFQYAIFFNNSTDLNKRFRDASRQVKLMENPSNEELTAHFSGILGHYKDNVELSVERTARYDEEFVEVIMSYAHTVDIPLADKYPLKSSYQNLIIISDEN